MKVTPFHHTVSIRFQDADPAGILFFANAFRLAHDVYEKFIEHLGFSFQTWFQSSDWGVPIRHAECDYFKPLLPFETYTAEVFVDKVGSSSFTSRYVLKKDDVTHCQIILAHTFVNMSDKQKRNIPETIKSALELYERQSGSLL